ncbi:Na/Pi cotransporter family protein [Roseovarius sp. SCSIO 43702]|uniref:Na/Pi cotransporter family protein n=1 Tax=Roseovarius sp. SCSIO 43702 TaxID=2823043 RepID=UPI001C731EB4|nr:Na/Pi cotransporter family protein [Roseovarius sp. SCSIO 43702]QYX56310.1 Na/Pi cotransporter family protein [Roseovarius sp. SCSIO 43702]
MALLSFLTQLAGATMLLLFAVRMVRTGIERAYGASFRRTVTAARNPVGAAGAGMIMAIILQSSAAVALLVAGFAVSGGLGFGTGLAMILGADLGSSLLIQVLSLKLDWLVPVLLAGGGFLFLKSSRRGLKQAGRIILGIAFILIALRFLRETMDPIRDSSFLPAIGGYLARDFITAFLTGAALAFVMHSSVATVLMCVTVVSIGALPLSVGMSLVLGANLGSALIPVWLSRGLPPISTRLPLANLILRGTFAFIAVIAVNRTPIVSYLPDMSAGQTLIVLHILFNASLLLTLPFCARLEGPLRRVMPDPPSQLDDVPMHHRSVLDEHALASPAQALACLRREVLRMTQVLQEMVEPVMNLYSEFSTSEMRAIRAKDEILNTALDDIRHYAAEMHKHEMPKRMRKDLRELMEYAIALEAAGDIVVKRLTSLAADKSEQSLTLSKTGLDELTAMHDRILQNLALASNVLISGDVESARLLLEEKTEMARLHRQTRKKHLKRLSAGSGISLDSSDIHLETANALKDMNSQIASLAYPILYREGQLLDTRLVTTMRPEHSEEE